MTRHSVGTVHLISAALMVTALAGCDLAKNPGSGPLTLSPGLTNYLDKYMKEGARGAFVVTEDGRHGLYRACTQLNCTDGDTEYLALQYCDGLDKGPCKTLAVGKTIVWQGPVTGADGTRINP